MIEKIDITGNNFKIDESLKKYIEKRYGKLDRYLPKEAKKDAVIKVIITTVGGARGDKYEISVAMEITGGKVFASKDECSNVFAGIDLIEAKLVGQIRRFKVETQDRRPKKGIKGLFKRS